MDNFFEILSESEIYSQKFNIKGKKLTVRIKTDLFKSYNDLILILNKINEIFKQVFEKLLENIPDRNNVRLTLTSESLNPDIFTGFMPKKNLTVDTLMNEIIKVTQSDSDFLLSDDLNLEVISVPTYQIGGRARFLNIDNWIRNSSKVIKIKPDGLCLAKSIVLSMSHHEKIPEKQWYALRKDVRKILSQKAIELYRNAGIEYDEENGMNIELLPKLQDYLLKFDFQLIAVSPPDNFIYKGIEAKKQIYVLINTEKNHSDCLLSIKAFLKKPYFCEKCFKGFSNYTSHICENRCKKCFQSGQCEDIGTKKYCNDCNQFFKSDNCFQTHLEKNVCEKRKICESCHKLYSKKHECNKTFCLNCKELVDISNHFCYITPLDKKKISSEDKIAKIFIFFDIETFLMITPAGLTHTPNQLCCIICCDKCWNPDERTKTPVCSFCSGQEKCYFGLDCVKNFLDFIFNDLNTFCLKNNEKMKFIAIAHNGKAFDFQFIIKHMLENRQKPKLLKRGTKILYISYKNYKFLDSINFITLPLSKFPSTFGIEGSRKGDFPFLFNEPKNWDYVGFYPPLEYYSPNKLKPNDATKLKVWHKQNKHKIFVFKDELEKYCHNDVKIMMTAIMLFRYLWIERYQIDCFTRSITLPSAIMELFKYKYLSPKTLAVIPHNGYESQRNRSYSSSVWLDYLEEKENIEIVREYKIIHYYADGYYKNVTTLEETIFEFLGCYYHGCPKCFPNNRKFKSNGRNSFDQLYKNTQIKLNLLRTKYIVISLWECEWKEIIKNDQSISNYVKYHLQSAKRLKCYPPLDPRNALIGGRVNGAKLYHKAEDCKIYHFDIRSLYPFVNKTSIYPYDHPKIIRQFDTLDIDKYEGLIFCRILPPRQLYFPVLGIKLDEKLLFPLCYECAKEKQFNCDHDERERSLISTWIIPEVKLALREGYKILEIFEIWHFEKTSDKLFYDIINDGIKDKIEASGWPKTIKNEKDREVYLKKFELIEGIKLDPNNIQDNPGRRFQGKAQVNCFWGRFALNMSNIKSTEIISDPNTFLKIILDPTLILNDVKPYNEETIEISYSKIPALIESNKNSNILVADFTTGYARMILYDYLKKLERRVLYFDTDSIIFFAKDGDYIPETGEFIGDLTDEIDDKNLTIEEFVCCGPKSYAYWIKNNSTGEKNYIIKMKGIRLNLDTKEIISFENLVRLVEEFCKESCVQSTLDVAQNCFTTTKFNDVIMRENIKSLRITYDKRKVLPDFRTLPYGYKYLC